MNVKIRAGGFKDRKSRFDDFGTDAVTMSDRDGRAAAGALLNG
ncbi:MAG: hypothetical protein ACYDEU_00700 [Vulcanimicrobiaceae bacterium]